jgi:hypothetical protein
MCVLIACLSLFLYDIMLNKIQSLNLGLNYDNYTH